MFTEEWKEKAVAEYKERQAENERKFKEKVETKERAEYERLKAKFEPITDMKETEEDVELE